MEKMTKARIFTLLFIGYMAAMTTVHAETINENQARAIAAQFMGTHARATGSLKMTHKAPRLGSAASDGKAAYYVFNSSATSGGYVIVAGDDRAPAVLGYSDQGSFDPADVPEAMQELLDGYAAQMTALSQGAAAASRLNSRAPITPLLDCAWSQGNPYNILLPFVGDKHVPVGCVATAMAQVMYYWKYPVRPIATIPAYTTESLSINMPALTPVVFEWSQMRHTYETYDTLSTNALAAATLSLYCAQSVEMDFTKNSSGASTRDVVTALINYFDYNQSARYISRESYTTAQWEDALYNELAASRPVIYRGSKASGGHAFVCDGYDGNGMYHFNWGWNGSSNGYFLLSVLNPDIEGTGSSYGPYGYIYSQAMIIGMRPGGSSSTNLEVTSKYIEILNFTGTRSSTNSDFTLDQTTHFLNSMSQSISFDYGWALYRPDNTMIKMIYSATRNSLKSHYYFHPSVTLSFGSGLSSGTYRIVPMYSEVGTGNWRPCLGADINYIEININGNSCTATAHGVSTTPNYTVNGISATGHMHVNRPVDINVNVTNVGDTRNDLIYMFANGNFFASAFVDVEKGNSADVAFSYMRDTPSYVNLTFSLNEDGSNPIASYPITITTMPQATLKGQARALNVVDASNKIINDNSFRVELTINNQGTSEYNEDIVAKLYKHTYGNYGTLVETKTQTISLAQRRSVTIQFDLGNVMDGWQYFVKTYYYSSGYEVSLAGTSTHTINFPDEPTYRKGDVNGDGEVNIADINTIIDIILGRDVSISVQTRADVDGNNEINIADVNAVIDLILGN